MEKIGIVSKLLNDGRAEVSVVREAACGGNCPSCEACIYQTEFSLIAENSIGAKPGQRVRVESETGKFFKIAFLVYIIPMITMVIGLIVPAMLNCSEGMIILYSFAGLAFGFLLIWLINKIKKPQIIYHISEV